MKRSKPSQDEILLERHGWTVECLSPFEIIHKETGSYASLIAAYTVLDAIREKEKQKIREGDALGYET